ncbi:MAG: hypothetical protein D9C04_01295 [Nitrosopumilus sp. B06]|nr:MAG: hypothetical protein D9C04_01295 [Nitrosopumilus sp. B06]
MDKNISSKSNQTATSSTPKRIKNTFSSNCRNEYFTPGSLFAECKYGFPFEDLPEEGKKMVLEYSREYAKRCTKTGDKVEFLPLPSGPGIIV